MKRLVKRLLDELEFWCIKAQYKIGARRGCQARQTWRQWFKGLDSYGRQSV